MTSSPSTTLPKQVVAAVEVLRILAVVADEELRTARVLACMGHRQHSAVVVLARSRSLALDGIAGTARTVAARAAALDDEIGNNAVEREPVVEIVRGQLDEVGHGAGRFMGVQFGFHRPFLGGDDGILLFVGHIG